MTLDRTISRVHLENNTVSAPDERQEFLTSLWIFPEYPQHRAGYCFTVHFLYPAHHHTHVPRRNGNKSAGTTHSPRATAEQLEITYVASITTPTPAGCKASVMAIAICLVRRSWTETTRSLEKRSSSSINSDQHQYIAATCTPDTTNIHCILATTHKHPSLPK